MNREIYNTLFDLGVIDSKSDSYIWIPEMEFLNPEAMKKRKILWNNMLKLDDLSIFAINGGGDLYAWDGAERVWFISHDTGKGELYAKCFVDAVFRHILEVGNGMYIELCSNEEKEDMDEDDAEFYLSDTESIEIFSQYIKAFEPYNNEEKKCIINSMIEKGFIEDGSFITFEQLHKIIKDKLDVDKQYENYLR